MKNEKNTSIKIFDGRQFQIFFCVMFQFLCAIKKEWVRVNVWVKLSEWEEIKIEGTEMQYVLDSIHDYAVLWLWRTTSNFDPIPPKSTLNLSHRILSWTREISFRFSIEPKEIEWEEKQTCVGYRVRGAEWPERKRRRRPLPSDWSNIHI
jgi:hypothetical protein